jgi:hypothetical protein
LLVACCVEKREMIFLAFGEKSNTCYSSLLCRKT